MAQLRQSSGDHHFFIMAGRSKGIRQIEEAGIDWLKKQKYSLPGPGGWVPLDRSDYRYLDGQHYLYTKDEDYTKLPAQTSNIPLIPPEAVHYGPPLLLQLADNYQNIQNIVPWKLILKLDEWESAARDALIRERAAAVGCYVISETGENIFSSISLQHINRVDFWPEVTPRKGNYGLFWQNRDLYQRESPSAKRLDEATPTPGLKTEWQGSVFFRFTDYNLRNTYKRYLPGMSIAASSTNELYWLAQSDQEPEPSWPGSAQRVGPTNMGWQLWHLQWTEENREEAAEWLWYRQIDLRPPGWRLRLLNPLSYTSEYGSICPPGQQLLVRCDPPTRRVENGRANVFLALSPYPKEGANSQRPLGGSPVRSQHFSSVPETYLRVPAPPANQKYRIYVDGDAQSRSLWVQAISLPARQPDWLHGLRCSLTVAGKKCVAKAFRNEPGSRTFVLSVQEHFPLDQLAQASWSYQPSGLSCSLRWEYLSVQNGLCQEPGKSLSSDQALTTWWQSYIWPAVAESPWVKLTLDAGSFGSIALRLILEQQVFEAKSTDTNQKTWWTNPHYPATFSWLSRMVEEEVMSIQQAVSPELSQALEQLSAPDLPETLQHVLTLLAEKRSLPLWISLRLQALLADISSTFRPVS